MGAYRGIFDHSAERQGNSFMITSRPVTVFASLTLGALIGALVILGGAYLGGYIQPEADAGNSSRSFHTTATNIINDFTCFPGETKDVFLGGLEDDYAPGGEAEIPVSDIMFDMAKVAGRPVSEVFRQYDQGSQNRTFQTYFNVSPLITRGVFVVKMRGLSSFQNDGLTIGILDSVYFDAKPGFGIQIADMNASTGWAVHDDIHSARFANIEQSLFEDYPNTLLEFIQSGPDKLDKFGVRIADDTQVDFIGVATCNRPDKALGVAYSNGRMDPRLDNQPYPEPWPDGLSFLSLTSQETAVCSAYVGCIPCETKQPVACFKFTGAPAPESALEMARHWAGGDIRYSSPVKGSRFATEDDVNAFCASEFGEGWRVLSHHEGGAHSVALLNGPEPPDNTRVWVSIKSLRHSNCWAQRPEFGVGDD